jgi:two-component system, chemotaxis family, chemotaxis protein CheY
MESKQPKVLLIDDDQFLLSLYAQKAKRYPIDFRTAQSGEKALEELRAGFTPDALLVDIEMPVMGGFEFIEAMRAENMAPKAAVIILTNKSEAGFVDRANQLGVQKYIVKATLVPSEIMDETLHAISDK